MENRNRIRRGWRKENALPAFSGHVTSGQRNVQKNVNINLFVDTGSHAVVSHHWGDPTVPVPIHSRATVCGGPRAALVGRRSVKSRRHGRVQTNLPCPDWPFQDVTGSVFNSRQQSNLESKLRRCRAENVTHPPDPNPLSATAFGPSHPCLHRVTWKGNAPCDFSDGRQYQSRRPSGGFRLHDLSHTCNDPCKRRLGDKDRYVLNRPLGHPSVSEGSGGAHKGSFSSTRSSSIPSAGSLLHDCRPPPNCSCQEVDAFSPGPPLTLDLLDASDQSEASSLAFQALLRSSQASADLHGSIQHSKKEAAQMGALGSFPWESKTAPLPYRSCLDPGVTTSALWSIPEESCARLASVEWQASLARDWGLRATVGTLGDANSIPVGFGCKNTRLYRHPVEALGQCWPKAAHSSNDSTSLAFEAKEDYSDPSICYLGCCSGCQKVPEGKTTCHLPKSHYHHQRIPNPEEHSSRLFCSPKLVGKDFPLGLPSLDGLEVSLETLCAGTPANKSVAMYDTQRDVHLTVGLPRGLRIAPVCHFGNSSGELGICEPWSEPVGIGETPVIAYATDDYTPFLPPYKPSPFRIIARNREHPPLADGTDGVGVAIAERLPMGSHHSSCEDLSTKPPHLEEQHQKLERGPGSMDRQRIRPASQETDPLLEKGFGAWRGLVLEKKAAAQALYERHLLRKGLGALKWALQLRDVEVGIAQRAHAQAVLATSFRRWQAATARKRKDQGAPQAAATPSQGVPAPPGEGGVLKGPTWCQLSAEQLKGAAQYSRAEGNLWLQLHRTQGVAELCAKAQAVRDVRRLAAFRLWRLQKEHQEEEEAQVQAALAILGEKRLRNAFRVWRSRSLASRQVLPLTAQVQSRWISRCFKAWKSFAEREAQSRRCLEHQRARSVGQCFRQWALMAQVRERARKSLLELFDLKRRKLHGLNTPETEMCWNVAKWSQWNRADTLEGLYHVLRLQAAFQIWVVRWREHQLANVFRRTLEQRQLREILRWWHWKAFCLDNLACCNPKDLTEDPLLASLDLEESSLSSGFHSNAPALPVSSPFIKENSPGSGSHASISSLGTAEVSDHHPQTNSPSLRPSPDPEEFVSESTEVHIRASSPPTNGCVGENGFLKYGFQSLGFLSPSSQIQPIVTSSMWDRVQSRGNETEWQLLVRCFEIWSAQTRQNLKARQHHRHTLLTRFFTPWAVAVARAAAQRMALVQFEHTQQQRLLAISFEKWKAESASVVQRQREAEQRWRPSGQGAAWRHWRKATCRARGMASVERACNFWTRAAAFGLCAHQRSSLIGVRKFLKMPLSWTVAGGCRAKRCHLGPAPDSRLTCSSFRLWLTMYRSQSRTLERLPGAGSAATQAQSQESSSVAADHRRGLGRKYLRRWRDNVQVRHFQDAWKMRQLVSAWLLWKDACRTALGLQALVRHRLVQWGWQTWRRRCLQSWVAERFLAAADRRLLERVFGRWQRLAALRTEGKVNS